MDILLTLILITSPLIYVIGLGLVVIKFFSFLSSRTAPTPTHASSSIHASHVSTSYPKIVSTSHHQDSARWLSWCLGFLYVLVVNWYGWPTGLQLSIIYSLWLGAIFYISFDRQLAQSKVWQLIMAISLLIAGYAALTTNVYLDLLNKLSVLGVGWASLIFIARGTLPKTIGEMIAASFNLMNSLFIHLFEWSANRRLLVLPNWKWSWKQVSTEKLIGFAIAIPLLTIFHWLFARTNQEYALFVTQLLQWMWMVIKFIWELDIIELFIKTLVTSFIFYQCFDVKAIHNQAKLSDSQQLSLQLFHIVIYCCIGIFGLFSFFQSQLLFINYAQVTFKVLSTYVIQGFWELLAAALIGYTIILAVLSQLIQSRDKETVYSRSLLTIFAIELMLVILFTLHKLGIHQLFFGFKDQRLLATGAVILVLMTFLMLLGRIWKYIQQQQVFAVQVVATLAMILGFNVMNLDWFITRFNPVSYYQQGQKYKDYSYLLGNSYDNYGEWEKLITEMEVVKPPQPDTDQYYYGWYPSLCQSRVDAGPYAMYNLSSSRTSTHTSYLENKYLYLERKYGTNSPRELHQIFQFNWREYQAFHAWQRLQPRLTTVVTQICSQ
ncbi:MAG TPA: DUF4153 domain-containing protein [Vitreimonas sp.]|nr:DUF4153 domain-containing protein [Vitreimonas sp.]